MNKIKPLNYCKKHKNSFFPALESQNCFECMELKEKFNTQFNKNGGK